MEIRCRKCGKIIEDSSFCYFCGEILDENAFGEEVAEDIREQSILEDNNNSFENERITEQDNISASINEIIVTTTPSIEGYEIKEYLGLISGEVVFKAGFLTSVKASVSDFVNSFALFEKEMSGSTKIMNKARLYAEKKLRFLAAERGANAIVGVDMESTLGMNSIMQVTIYGTAVVVHRK